MKPITSPSSRALVCGAVAKYRNQCWSCHAYGSHGTDSQKRPAVEGGLLLAYSWKGSLRSSRSLVVLLSLTENCIQKRKKLLAAWHGSQVTLAVSLLRLNSPLHAVPDVVLHWLNMWIGNRKLQIIKSHLAFWQDLLTFLCLTWSNLI